MVAHVTHRELWWTSGREAWSSVACGVRFMCNKNQFKGGDHVDRSAAACGSAGDDQRRLVQQRYDAISTPGAFEGEDLPVAVQRKMVICFLSGAVQRRRR